MQRITFKSFLLASLMVFSLFVAGCGSKESGFMGTYESADKSKLVLQSEHKGNLTTAGVSGDITWEVTGADKIAVHAGIPIEMFKTSDGNLRDSEGTVWVKK